MYRVTTFENACVYMSDINRCKDKAEIIHVSRYAVMFIKQADYLDIYSTSFEVTKDYGKCQDVSKSHPVDGPN